MAVPMPEKMMVGMEKATKMCIRDRAVAGGLLTGQGAAIGESFAGEDTHKAVGQALILAEHITDLPGSYANITGGHIGIGADMTIQLSHKALAEAHDLPIALALSLIHICCRRTLPPLLNPPARPNATWSSGNRQWYA